MENDAGAPAGQAEMFLALQKTFGEFQLRADKLDRAYRAMQDDFGRLNIELDGKNRELAAIVKKQEETQTYLNSILASMNNGVIGVDIVGVITHFNRAAADISGFTPDEVIDRAYQQVFPHTQQPELSLLRVLSSGRQLPHGEKVVWHKDGHPVPVSFQTALLRDTAGTLLGAVEVFTDISRIKALEEEMQRTRTMAALGEMSATVAHEIRNPLGAMGVWAGLLDRDIATDDPRKRTLRKIIEGLSKLNRIVSNLLVYTRPMKADTRRANLNDILREMVDFVEIEVQRLGQKVAVRKEWDDTSPAYVMADPEKLQQAVMNLCLNSIQAMPAGGTLTVRIGEVDPARSGFIPFVISDTGVGIEKERIDRIFDPFHTTKEDGTGLGLAIVKKIIEHHAGYIDVRSTVGEGTQMRVFLPQARDNEHAADGRRADGPAARGSGK